MKIKSFTYSFLALNLLIMLPGCFSKTAEKKSGLVLVNVLDKELYEDCHIQGSVNIPFDMIEESADIIDRSAQVVIYCSNCQCSSSEYAARKLKEKGFANVCVYEGGMAEWYQEGLPVEGPQKQAYLKKSCSQLPADEHAAVPVISVDELAQKMGIEKRKKQAA